MWSTSGLAQVLLSFPAVKISSPDLLSRMLVFHVDAMGLSQIRYNACSTHAFFSSFSGSGEFLHDKMMLYGSNFQTGSILLHTAEKWWSSRERPLFTLSRPRLITLARPIYSNFSQYKGGIIPSPTARTSHTCPREVGAWPAQALLAKFISGGLTKFPWWWPRRHFDLEQQMTELLRGWDWCRK